MKYHVTGAGIIYFSGGKPKQFVTIDEIVEVPGKDLARVAAYHKCMRPFEDAYGAMFTEDPTITLVTEPEVEVVDRRTEAKKMEDMGMKGLFDE